MKNCSKGFEFDETTGVCFKPMIDTKTCKDNTSCLLRSNTYCDSSSNVCTSEEKYACDDGSSCEVKQILDKCPSGSVQGDGFLSNVCVESILSKQVLEKLENTVFYDENKNVIVIDTENSVLKVSSKYLKFGSLYGYTEYKIEDSLKLKDNKGIILLENPEITMTKDIIIYNDSEYEVSKDEDVKKLKLYKKQYVIGVISILILLILVLIFSS